VVKIWPLGTRASELTGDQVSEDRLQQISADVRDAQGDDRLQLLIQLMENL